MMRRSRRIRLARRLRIGGGEEGGGDRGGEGGAEEDLEGGGGGGDEGVFCFFGWVGWLFVCLVL